MTLCAICLCDRLEGKKTLRYRCFVGPRAEKFNIVSNDHGRTHKYNFSVFNRKSPFWANLLKTNQNISLSGNLLPRLSRICGTQWRCSLFLFTFSLYLFWVNLVQKIKIVSFSWNSVLRLIWICRIQWWCLLFLFWSRNTLFEQIWSKKSILLV